MKHKRLAAAVLAAALWLTGCGSAAAPAAPAGSGTAAQSTADTAVQTAQKDRITEQFTLEKTIRDEYGITQKLTIHVPQLVCDSPDAAYLNDAGAWLVTAVGLPNGIGEAVVAAVIVPMIKIAVEAVMRRSRRAPARRAHSDK